MRSPLYCQLPFFAFACFCLLAASSTAQAQGADVKSGAFADTPINLAFVLPKAAPAHHDTISLSETDKIVYDAGVVGVGAAVAADDRGLYCTIQGSSGPSQQTVHNATQVSHLAELTVLPAILGGAYLIGDHVTRDIAWRASVAVVHASLIGFVLKAAVGRERPQGIKGGSAATFHPGTANSRYDSFPSGHTLAAFAACSVWAGKRPDQRYLAYGIASAVGASRLIKGAHWPSDVFWGAVIGITQGRQALKGNANLLSVRF